MQQIRISIERHRGNYVDSIAFLNSPVKSFFSGFTQFEKAYYSPYLKSIILDMIIDIERVIKGTFNCELSMEEAKYDTLMRMFPNGLSLFGMESQDDVIKMGSFFEALRNSSAHMKSSQFNSTISDFNFYHLREQKVYNPDIVYEKHGHLTVAGMLFIIFNFLREESIATALKQDNLFGFITNGQRGYDDGTAFVSEISKTNLEIPIRTVKGRSVVSSICANYPVISDEEFAIAVGDSKNPTYIVNGHYKNSILTIGAKSLTKTYYHSDYNLTIKREDLFIDLANKFPPVVLVDLLYLMKVSTFDEAVYQDILDKYETTYCKLNYPKFYIDKNINILLLPSSISDYRMVSSMATSSISFVMSDLEFSLMNVVGIRSKNDYSRLQSFLKEIGMPNDLRLDVVVLRNFAMHGYVFGEYIVFDDMSYQFTLDFLIKTLERLLLFCKDYNEKLFQVLTRAISDRVVNKFVAAKYRKAIETTKQYVQEGPSIELKKALFVKNEFIRHSFYDVRDLNKLNSLSLDEPIVLEVKVKDTNDYFYFYSQTDEQKALLNEFLRQNNYRIKKEIRDGVVTEIYVE